MTSTWGNSPFNTPSIWCQMPHHFKTLTTLLNDRPQGKNWGAFPGEPLCWRVEGKQNLLLEKKLFAWCLAQQTSCSFHLHNLIMKESKVIICHCNISQELVLISPSFAQICVSISDWLVPECLVILVIFLGNTSVFVNFVNKSTSNFWGQKQDFLNFQVRSFGKLILYSLEFSLSYYRSQQVSMQRFINSLLMSVLPI